MKALVILATLLSSATAGACTIVELSGAYRGTIAAMSGGGEQAQTQLFSAAGFVGMRSNTAVIRPNGSVAGYVVGNSLLSAGGRVLATGVSCNADQLAFAHLVMF